MAPRKGETQEQRIQRWHETSFKLQNKIRYKKICAALNNNHHVLSAVERQLYDLGVMTDSEILPHAQERSLPFKDEQARRSVTRNLFETEFPEHFKTNVTKSLPYSMWGKTETHPIPERNYTFMTSIWS